MPTTSRTKTVTTKLGTDQVAQIEAAIDAEINSQKTPTHGVGTPWG